MKSAAVRTVILLGVVYFVAGIVLGALAGRAGTQQTRTAWRLAAWIISIVAFVTHIAYDQVRLRSAPKITALRAALGAALGSFGLAAAANVHALTVSPPRPSLLLALSLVLWPVLTALPAFVVALVIAIVLARVGRSR